MNLILQIQNKQKKYPAKKYQDLVHEAIQKTLSSEKISMFIEQNQITPVFSIIFTNNKGIRELNCEFREIDKITDILSFPLIEANQKIITKVSKEDIFVNEKGQKEIYFGDIAISFERADEQAQSLGHSVEREVTFLIVHSTLHLLGYDHIDIKDEKKMIKRQKIVMKSFSPKND